MVVLCRILYGAGRVIQTEIMVYGTGQCLLYKGTVDRPAIAISKKICIYLFYLIGYGANNGYGSLRGDTDVWNGLDKLRFRMDRGCGSHVRPGMERTCAF